jgi:hypothetical protein
MVWCMKKYCQTDMAGTPWNKLKSYNNISLEIDILQWAVGWTKHHRMHPKAWGATSNHDISFPFLWLSITPFLALCCININSGKFSSIWGSLRALHPGFLSLSLTIYMTSWFSSDLVHEYDWPQQLLWQQHIRDLHHNNDMKSSASKQADVLCKL